MNYGSAGIKRKARKLRSIPTKIQNKIIVWFFRLVVAGIAAAMVIVTCVGLGAFAGIIETAPNISLDSITPTGFQTYVYDSEGNQTEKLIASGANRIQVDISNVPENLKNAFIAIEDSRFYDHNGIDPKGIVRAVYVMAASGFKRTEGASTITQQLIKNNIFSAETESGKIDTVKRKFQEQYLALILEQNVSKDVILENYLNTINLGNGNLGVQAASRNYFNKDVSELTLSECAVIAGITQNPYKYNPITHPDKNAERREKVLSDMKKQNLITQAQYDEAMADSVYDRIMNISTSNTNEYSAYSYYTDALVTQLMEDLMSLKGYTQTQAYNLIYRGGLQIYSCEDSNLQQFAVETINDPENWSLRTDFTINYRLQIKDKDGKIRNYTEGSIVNYYQTVLGMTGYKLLFSTREEAQEVIDNFKAYKLQETGGTEVPKSESINYVLEPQASFVVIEQSTGYVRALVGGRGDKQYSLVLNRAMDSTRSPGSTFKLLSVYSAAIDTAGMTLATVYDDMPYLYATGKLVTNVDDEYHGLMNIREAITVSRNIPAVEIITDISPELGYSYALNFGISTLTPEEQHYQSIALGGLTNGATNYEMTAAYAAIGNYGTYIKPKLYTKVLDHDGNILIDNTAPESHQVLKESSAWLLTSALRSVVTEGSATWLYDDIAYYAGKSGTSQLNTDKWFVGYSPYYTAGIWIGNDDSTVVNSDIYIMPQLLIWKKIMDYAHNDLPYAEFQKPYNIVECEVCSKSGKLAIDDLCDCDPRGSQIITEYFEMGTEPTEVCDKHIKLNICAESGFIANEFCPEDQVEERVFVIKESTDIDFEELDIDPEEYKITDTEFAVTEEMLEENICTIH